MQEIEIRKQRQMTLTETLDFCVSSIRHRFMRSLLTLSVVVLAVAFFMFLQCSNVFRNSVKGGVEQEILQHRKPSRILSMLYSPCTSHDFAKMLVEARKMKGEKERIAKAVKISKQEMNMLVQGAFEELTYLQFFDNLTIGRRKELFTYIPRKDGLSKEQLKIATEPITGWDNKEGLMLEGRDRLIFLCNKTTYEKKMLQMREMGGIRVPGGPTAFRKFLDKFDEYKTLSDRAFNKWKELQSTLKVKGKELSDSTELRRYLLSFDKDAIDKWEDKLEDAGFELEDEEIDNIINYLKVSEKLELIQELLSRKEFRTKWRRTYGQNQYNRTDEKLQHVADRKSKAFLVGAEFSNGQKVTENDLENITDEFNKRQLLRDLELQLDIDILKDASGFTASQLYLMCLSFLVCVVGITNAMLMSITERFREIATLKCLGATDSFILIQIVLEALIQGIIGGLAGLILGFIVALTHSICTVGPRVFNTFDFRMIGLAALFSLLAGILLSVLSSLYPSTKAARMAPMEAMRVE